MPKVLAKMSEQVWKDIGLPSYNGDKYDFEHKYKVIVKLFERIKKYHRRGVMITNAPDGALDWDIPDLARDPNYDSGNLTYPTQCSETYTSLQLSFVLQTRVLFLNLRDRLRRDLRLTRREQALQTPELQGHARQRGD